MDRKQVMQGSHVQKIVQWLLNPCKCRKGYHGEGKWLSLHKKTAFDEKEKVRFANFRFGLMKEGNKKIFKDSCHKKGKTSSGFKEISGKNQPLPKYLLRFRGNL